MPNVLLSFHLLFSTILDENKESMLQSFIKITWTSIFGNNEKYLLNQLLKKFLQAGRASKKSSQDYFSFVY